MYTYFSEQIIKDFSHTAIEEKYAQGFVFTRLRKGSMQEVKSLRINLSLFTPTSENRRILKRAEGFTCSLEALPYAHYHWPIGKMATDFYTQKFGRGIMSANKIKELMTDPGSSNMNAVFVYRIQDNPDPVGYCLSFSTESIVHYAYPFYRITNYELRITGLAMMIKVICWSQAQGKQYIYLGSAHDVKSLYKLQFRGLEWWDHSAGLWQTDPAALKQRIQSEEAVRPDTCGRR